MIKKRYRYPSFVEVEEINLNPNNLSVASENNSVKIIEKIEASHLNRSQEVWIGNSIYETDLFSLVGLPENGSLHIDISKIKDLSKKFVENSKKSVTYVRAAQEKFRKERAVNLYYHLHSPKRSLFDISNESNSRFQSIQNQLKELPSIKKYKNYLKKRNLRFPSCLEIKDRPKLPYLNN